MTRCIALMAAVLLTACAAPAPVPEPNWYRLAAPPTMSLSEALAPAIAVSGFRSVGIHGEQAMIYADDPQALRLRQYNYHLWSEPPAQMIERRLADVLRQAGAAALVSERLPNRREGLRISGSLLAMERLNHGDHWQVKVALQLRVEPADRQRAAWSVEYVDQRPAAGSSIQDSVQAWSAGVDTLLQRFLDDLEAWGRQ